MQVNKLLCWFQCFPPTRGHMFLSLRHRSFPITFLKLNYLHRVVPFGHKFVLLLLLCVHNSLPSVFLKVVTRSATSAMTRVPMRELLEMWIKQAGSVAPPWIKASALWGFIYIYSISLKKVQVQFKLEMIWGWRLELFLWSEMYLLALGYLSLQVNHSSCFLRPHYNYSQQL